MMRCGFCGKEFVSVRAHARYCCERCRRRAQDRRRRHERREAAEERHWLEMLAAPWSRGVALEAGPLDYLALACGPLPEPGAVPELRRGDFWALTVGDAMPVTD